MTALRDNAGKPELSQVLWLAHGIEAVAAHMAAGRKKYPDRDGMPNFMLGGKPDQEYLDAAVRHLLPMVAGDHYDEDLGTLHAAAVAWNMLALMSLNLTHLDTKVTGMNEYDRPRLFNERS